MPDTSDKRTGFLDALCAQIRVDSARNSLRREYAAHLEDHAAALIREGVSPAEAMDQAVDSMGDPVLLGQQLDRIHRPRIHWGLLAGTFLLVGAGAILHGCAALWGGGGMGSYWVSVLWGGAGLLLFQILDHSLLGKRPCLVYGLLLAALAASAALPAMEGRALIQVLALFLPPLFAAAVWSQRRRGFRGILLSCGLWALGCFLGASSVTLASMGLSMLLLLVWAGEGWFTPDSSHSFSRWKALLSLSGLLTGIGAPVLWRYGASLWRRLSAPFDPGQLQGAGWPAAQVRQVIGHARWWGAIPAEELGGELERMLPDWGDSLLLAWTAGRYGLLPALGAAGGICVLMVGMWLAAFRLRGALGRMVSLGCAAVFTGEWLLFLSANLGLSMTGGNGGLLGCGWSLGANLLLMGIALSCCRGRDLCREPQPPPRLPLPQVELRIRPPHYEKGEIAQMMGIIPPPEESRKNRPL